MQFTGGVRRLVRRGVTLLSTVTLGLIGLVVGGGPALAQVAPDPAGPAGGSTVTIPGTVPGGTTSTGTSVLTVVLIALAAAAFAAIVTLAMSTYQRHHQAPTPA